MHSACGRDGREPVDFPKHADAASFPARLPAVVDNLKKSNFDTIIFQVHPMNDAFTVEAESVVALDRG
ncbi:MAG: hypothetical protein V8T86_13065 [Victivallis sp.]